MEDDFALAYLHDHVAFDTIIELLTWMCRRVNFVNIAGINRYEERIYQTVRKAKCKRFKVIVCKAVYCCTFSFWCNEI